MKTALTIVPAVTQTTGLLLLLLIISGLVTGVICFHGEIMRLVYSHAKRKLVQILQYPTVLFLRPGKGSCGIKELM